MNADRLHALLLFLQEDFNSTQLPRKLVQLSKALSQQIQTPQASHQQAVGTAFKEVITAAEESGVDDISPAWRVMIEEIGFSGHLGRAVADRLNEAFRMAEVTATIVKEEVDEVSSKLNELREAVDQAIPAFEKLSIGAEQLGEGECEVGFMIPRKAINGRLDVFANECRDFDFIFGTFSEVALGARDHYKITTISSSDLSVYLESAPAVAALVATAIERLIAVYKQLLEIRKLRSEMLKQSVPKAALAEIDKHANATMAEEIEKITLSVMQQHGKIHEAGRKNELENSVRISLQKLANRIDRGYHLEIRIGEVSEPDGNESPSTKVLKAQSDTIRSASKALEFVNFEGEPILKLKDEAPPLAPKASSPPRKTAKKARKPD